MRIDGDRRRAHIEVWGVDTPHSMSLRIAALLWDPGWVPGYDMILDFTHLTALEFTETELEDLALVHKDNRDRLGTGCVVFVDPNPTRSGIQRLLDAAVRARPDCPPRLFPSLEAAEEYLTSQNGVGEST